MPRPRPILRSAASLALLVGACAAMGPGLAGCRREEAPKRVAAPQKGVVGKVTRIQGEATWSQDADGKRHSLRVGDEVRAEWTVHTSPGGGLSVRFLNGHLWTLSGDVSKRVSKADALSLPPTREGALAWVADLGGKKGQDRTSAAGLHHERQLGTKASPTQSSAVDKSATTTLEDGLRSADLEGEGALNEDPTKRPGAGRDEPTASAADEIRPTSPPGALPSARPVPAKPVDGRQPVTKAGEVRRHTGGSTGKGRSRSGLGALGGDGGGGRGGSPGPKPSGGAPKAKVADDFVEKPLLRSPQPTAAAPKPPPAKPPQSGAPAVTGRETAAKEALPEAPDRRSLVAAITAQRSRLIDVLKKAGLRGTQVVQIEVQAGTGRVIVVRVGSRGPTDAVCLALRRIFASVALPRTSKPYRFPIRVVVP